MQDLTNGFDTSMLGLDRAHWVEKLEEIVDEDGYFHPLGDHHWATLIEDKPCLLVTFETIDEIQRRGGLGQPLGFFFYRELGWSILTVVSDGKTWFRDPAVYGYFDRLVDDGFFDEFDQILFYGNGVCGYAAAAFSVCAPGSKVVAIAPQASLDTSITGWDKRFPNARRLNFSDRYGYAPDMLEAADEAHILYSKEHTEDAMHATLFRAQNTQIYALPRLGAPVEDALLNMDLLQPILEMTMQDRLSRPEVFRLLRARRDDITYLRHLWRRLEQDDRVLLVALLCANVTSRMSAPRFARRLAELDKAAATGTLSA